MIKPVKTRRLSRAAPPLRPRPQTFEYRRVRMGFALSKTTNFNFNQSLRHADRVWFARRCIVVVVRRCVGWFVRSLAVSHRSVVGGRWSVVVPWAVAGLRPVVGRRSPSRRRLSSRPTTWSVRPATYRHAVYLMSRGVPWACIVCSRTRGNDEDVLKRWPVAGLGGGCGLGMIREASGTEEEGDPALPAASPTAVERKVRDAHLKLRCPFHGSSSKFKEDCLCGGFARALLFACCASRAWRCWACSPSRLATHSGLTIDGKTPLSREPRINLDAFSLIMVVY